MSEPFVGEIRMFAGNFAPRGWATCDGQLLLVNQNDELFSLVGTIYGGDGRSTFGLPDLRGRLPIHYGSGPGLSARKIGQKSGTETEVLSASEVAPHQHTLAGSTSQAIDTSPAGNVTATAAGSNIYGTNVTVDMSLDAISLSGDTSPKSHSNLMPSQCLTFIIALVGVYPSRS